MLAGDRVRLRALERDDLRTLWLQRNDLEVEARVTDSRPTPKSLAAMQADFDALPGRGQSDCMTFAIEAADEVVGRLDLWGIDPHNRLANIGIALRSSSWSKGYGSEAVALVVDYAFTHLNLRKICLQYLANDQRAAASYAKAGFVEEGRLRAHNWFEGDYHDLVHMARFRD